jgi:hypothetical protein
MSREAGKQARTRKRKSSDEKEGEERGKEEDEETLSTKRDSATTLRPFNDTEASGDSSASEAEAARSENEKSTFPSPHLSTPKQALILSER